MKLLLLSSSFFILFSFNSISNPFNPFQKETDVQIVNSKKVRPITVSFQWDIGGCHYDLTAIIESTTGSGYGMIIKKCGKGKATSIAFDLYGANFARITAANLGNFKDEEGATYTPASDEVTSIIDGYNANYPEE